MAKRFTVLAQSMTTSQRITRTVEAHFHSEVPLLVSKELDDAGFYVVAITEVVR